MHYKFETTASDLSDLASGTVFRSAPGRPAFPVRLASELFQRAHALWSGGEHGRPCTLFDPCCGNGYSLAVLKLLHWPIIRRVTGSDVDLDALRLARANLDLLRPQGIEARIRILAENLERFGRPSYAAALESALRLQERIKCLSLVAPLDAEIAEADALDPAQLAAIAGPRRPDIIFADVPYESSSMWMSTGADGPGTAMDGMTLPGINWLVAACASPPWYVAQDCTAGKLTPATVAWIAASREVTYVGIYLAS